MAIVEDSAVENVAIVEDSVVSVEDSAVSVEDSVAVVDLLTI